MVASRPRVWIDDREVSGVVSVEITGGTFTTFTVPRGGSQAGQITDEGWFALDVIDVEARDVPDAEPLALPNGGVA